MIGMHVYHAQTHRSVLMASHAKVDLRVLSIALLKTVNFLPIQYGDSKNTELLSGPMVIDDLKEWKQYCKV